MFDRQLWRHFDWPLLAAVLALTGLGIAMVYSATFNTLGLEDYWLRQTMFAGVGVALIFVVAFFDYRHLELLAPPAWIFLFLALLAVQLFGVEQGGSQRWLNIGFTLVQPSEAGKFLIIIILAWYLSWSYERMGQLRYLLGALLLLLPNMALIYLQPNLGMTLVYGVVGGTLILAGGIRMWQVGLIGAGAAAMAPVLWGTLQGYMLSRIQVFLDPASDPDSAFNVNQALIAVGNGGWLGQGWGYGSQNQLHFLRVRHTDFIFSVIAEELGWVGAVLVLLLLLFVVWRLLRIADLAQDHFGRLIATGVAALIFFQVVVNTGMNMSLMPVTGQTLPFVSYGGSSLVSMLFVIGLAQSVVMRHRKMEFM